MTSYAASKTAFRERQAVSARSQATLDDQFAQNWASIQQLDELVDRVRRHTQLYLDSMKQLMLAGHAVADDFKSFYERESDRLTTISIKYETIQHGFRTDKIALLERLIHQNVFARLDELGVELSALKSKVADREVARKRYDHYTSKIRDLRETNERAKAKGKEVKSSELEKLLRNEKKYEDARMDYVAVNHVVAKALWVTWSQRHVRLDPIYAELLKIKANFTQALHNQLQTIVAPLKEQMQVEIKQDVMPAIFGGPQPSALAGVDPDGDDPDSDRRVMSPGGTTEMDARQVNARMKAANEKLEADARQRQLQQQQQIAAQQQQWQKQSKAARAQPQDDEDDEEEDEEAIARRKAKAKAKAAKAAAAAAAAAQQGSEETESDSEDEAAARRRRKEKKERKKAAAAAGASGASTKPASGASLDFFADAMAAAPATAAPAKKKTTGAADGGFDLLSFAPSPAKAAPSTSLNSTAAAAPLLDFGATSATHSRAPSTAMPVAAPVNTNAPAKKSRLELDSFFGSSGALMPPAESTAAAGDTNAPVDPFFDLPTVEPQQPVDLLAIPSPQQQQQPPPAQPQQSPYHQQGAMQSPHYSQAYQQPPLSQTFPPTASRAPSLASTQPGLYGAVAPGGPPASTLDDPFFAAPLPLPTSLTPKAPQATAAPAAKAKAKKKYISSDEESSEISSDSDDDQQEGRPAHSKASAAPRPATQQAPAQAPTPFGGISDLHITPTAIPAAASAAKSPAANALAAAASRRAPPAPGVVTPAAASPMSPEAYSPTREDYDPHAGAQKPPADDPFGGVNDDW